MNRLFHYVLSQNMNLDLWLSGTVPMIYQPEMISGSREAVADKTGETSSSDDAKSAVLMLLHRGFLYLGGLSQARCVHAHLLGNDYTASSIHWPQR